VGKKRGTTVKAVKALIPTLFALLCVMLFVLPVLAESASKLGTSTQLKAVPPTIPFTSTPTPTPLPTIPPIPPRPIAVKIEGVITAISDSLPGDWYIDDIAVFVTVETVILPTGYLPQVGDYATVNATREGNVVTANRIRIRVDEDVRPIEFRGAITAFPPAPFTGDWSISGVNVMVKSRTTLILEAPPAVGYYAHVQGWIQPDRRVDAISIRVLNPFAVAAEFEFQGAIETMATTQPAPWVIAGVRGMVSEDTRIEGEARIGAQVEVTGQRLADGSLIFEHILVLAEETYEVRLAGTIKEMNDDSWIISDMQLGDVAVQIDSSTFIDESRGRAAVGMHADVIARRGFGGRLTALRIRVERPT
jgi:hypothetical protein